MTNRLIWSGLPNKRNVAGYLITKAARSGITQPPALRVVTHGQQVTLLIVLPLCRGAVGLFYNPSRQGGWRNYKLEDCVAPIFQVERVCLSWYQFSKTLSKEMKVPIEREFWASLLSGNECFEILYLTWAHKPTSSQSVRAVEYTDYISVEG